MNNQEIMFKEGVRISYFGEEAVVSVCKPEFTVITFENKTASMLSQGQLKHAFKKGELVVIACESSGHSQEETRSEDFIKEECLKQFFHELHNKKTKKSNNASSKDIARICKRVLSKAISNSINISRLGA